MNFIKALLLIAVAFPATAQQSLEQYLSHPMASNLAQSQDGKQIAWVLNDHGKRNIYVQGANGTPRQLTKYAEDDGQELSDLLFSNDGKLLIYVRGGAANRTGQNPNPASLADGVEQAIWCVSTEGNADPFMITPGSHPVNFRSGNQILFSKSGQILTAELSSTPNPTLLFYARGNNGSYSFSPSGNEVLFASDRGDHGFIGVYTLGQKHIRWIAPEVSNDQLPVWSPDGKQIVFIRTPGTKAGELSNLTGGTRFSVWVADATTGRAVSIWTSPSDDGGFAQYYPNTPLAWTKTNRILFFSEHEGWNHLYSMTPDGKDVKDITPGDGIVESYTLADNDATIYFDGNREDIDRRHIWKSSVTEGKPVSVTSGEGIEMYPQVINGLVYCFQSTYNTSMSLVAYDAKKKVYTTVSPQSTPTFSAKGFVKPEQIILKAADGTTIHGQLFVHRELKGKRPGLVFMHGGPIRQMLLAFHYSDYYINSYAFNQYLASQGYAVISVNYRDGIGYGRDFRRAKNQGPRGASEYQDVVAAGKYLQSLPEVDASKIGLWGGSYGGYLTAMGLARNPELFKAGVDLHGVHDWAFRAREFSPGGSWGIGAGDMELAYKSSPVSDLSKWTGPVLLIHGDDDRNVLFQQTTDLAEKLRDKKVPVEILVLPDEVHGFLRYDSWSRVYTAAKDFFDRKLK